MIIDIDIGFFYIYSFDAKLKIYAPLCAFYYLIIFLNYHKKIITFRKNLKKYNNSWKQYL